MSLQRVRDVIEALTPDMVITLSGGRIRSINEAGLLMLRLNSEAEALGRPMIDFIHPDHSEAFEAQTSHDEPPGAPFPLTLVPRTGPRVDVSLRQVRLDDGTIVIVAHDIGPENKQARAFYARENEFRGILDTVVDGIIAADTKGCILWVNPATARIFGYDKSDLTGKNVSILMPPADSQVHDKLIANYRRTGTSKVLGKGRELHGLRKDGTTFPLEIAVTHLERGENPLLIAVLRDITARRRTEQERDMLRDQFFQAQKMEAIGTLASGIAHDFNNIVNSIMAKADAALAALPEDSPAEADLHDVMTAGWRAADIVAQLLTFSREQGGEREAIELADVIGEVIPLIRTSGGRRLELHYAIPEGSHRIHADGTQIHQVLMNLCVNACHAMDDGRGRLALEVARVPVDAAYGRQHPNLEPRPGIPVRLIPGADDPSRTIVWIGLLKQGVYERISVSDTGKGMDRQTVERIFEPFYTTKPTGQGTGLGLSAVHGIILGHGGAIVVDTGLGEGTTFHLFLPCLPPETDAERAEPAVRQDRTGGSAPDQARSRTALM